MLTSNIAVITKPCSSCGAYGGTDCQFSCQPGRRITQGHFRGAPRSACLSALILENQRIQDSLIAGVTDSPSPQPQAVTIARI
jgi:hypothetical protein